MKDTRFGSRTSHPRFVSDASLLGQLATVPLGTLRTTGRVEQRERSRRYVEAVCSVCLETRWLLVDNVRRGKTKGCMCQRNRKYGGDPRVGTLGQRYDAMVQRCERDSHVSSHRYKGRGIKVLFDSREHFIRWALSTFPSSTFAGMDFDRTDNTGHYSPENLRLVTRSVNLLNRG